MGRFAPDNLARQQVFLAYQGGKLVAFVSFHIGQAEWTLDLMRSSIDAPDGTMHALVEAAIEEAAQKGIVRLSLAAMPLADANRALARINRICGSEGLRQFKESFASRTEPLYGAAPNPALLTLAAPDILLRIRYPDGF